MATRKTEAAVPARGNGEVKRVPRRGAITKKLVEKARQAKEKAVQAERVAFYGPPHLMITARAGSAKTTSLVQGIRQLKGLDPCKLHTKDPQSHRTYMVRISPSPQQQAIWDSISQSKSDSSVCMVAFNKSIATELQERVPSGVDAMTLHSMGYKAINRAFGYCRVESNRVHRIIEEILETPIDILRRNSWEVLAATEELVKLVKMNLVPLDIEDPNDPYEREAVDRVLQDLVDYYEIDFSPKEDRSYRRYRDGNGHTDTEAVMERTRRQVFDLVPKVVERCKEVARDKCVNFDDMVWIPVALGLPVFHYDVLCVDEAQDLNRCQQALCRMAGRRLVFCGDPKQAIYGFAGADCDSMPRLKEELGRTPQGCLELPLTYTRRCGKAIVREAQKYVPDFGYFEENPEGLVERLTYAPGDNDGYIRLVQDGDFVLCRVNAPLVAEFFRFVVAGRRVRILGRDLGGNLIRLVRRLRARDMIHLTQRLDEWLVQEEARERAKKFPSESRIIALHDKAGCIKVFMQHTDTVDGLITRMEQVFTDDRSSPGIRLSSIHKSKGLEARRVFLLAPKGASIPHPMARTPWAREQEVNIIYIAVTRAMEAFYYVIGEGATVGTGV